MKIAIRDDDTSFFTNPNELKKAHEFLGDFPISLSVVPFSVKDHTENKPYGNICEDYPRYNALDRNKELVEFLKLEMENKRYEILLHGINHEYKYNGDEWIPEMLFKDENQLYDEIEQSKSYLNSTLGTDISIFVAPSNMINRKGIRAIERQNLNFSGIIRHRDRDFSIQYLKNYIKRWSYRAFTGLQYGGVLKYPKHKELIAYPVSSIENMMKEYEYCKKYNNPFVLYTHYWELINNDETKDKIKYIVDMAIKDGAEPVFLSECFK